MFLDYENAFPDAAGEWDVPEEEDIYPKYNPDQDEIAEILRAPDVVQEIYAETIRAVEAGALTLAGLGLRGTIEAVCNDRKIVGRNLEGRITKMAAQGLVSSKDAERLHAIRFLGNDAAHEIRKPNKQQISIALKIINHMVQSVYLLDLEVSGKLETIISDEEEFKKLLSKNLRAFNAGDEYPLAKFLGKDIRRLGQGASALEAHLLSSINSGKYAELSVGKVAKFAESKVALQHFIVNS